MEIIMNVLKPKAIVGTNSWGGSVYGKLVRGSVVDEQTLHECYEVAKEKDLLIFDCARDYGLGKAQKILGEFGTKDIVLSAKYTPTGKYKEGQVKKSFEKDLQDFKRNFIDIYWLHLPNDIEENLSEMIELYHQGKIKYIGVSNFNLEECILAKEILARAGIPLYGVQNHYSLLDRKWEKEGLVDWCKEQDISFWAWAVLEEGMLVNPKIKTGKSIMKILFNSKKRKLGPLYILMSQIGKKYHLTIPQVAISFCSSKGIVPICGCRRPNQAKELKEAVNTRLSIDEIQKLEDLSDTLNVKILGADMFRFAVKK